MRYFEVVGKPKICIKNNATYFTNRSKNDFCKKNNTEINFTSIRHPQQIQMNGIFEKYLKF